MFFLNVLEIIFPLRGHSIICEKIDYMPIFHAGSWGPGGPWHLKKWCHKKYFCAEVIFIHKGHFWEMHKENEAFL